MKLLLTVIVFLISLGAFARDDSINPRNWQPVIGAKKSPNVSLFFDRNNHLVTHLDKGDYVSGSILFVSKDNVMINVGGKKIPTKSMMKNYVVDCSTGIALAYADYYFSVSKPTIVSDPVAYLFREMDSAETFAKSSLIYSLFCPTFV